MESIEALLNCRDVVVCRSAKKEPKIVGHDIWIWDQKFSHRKEARGKRRRGGGGIQAKSICCVSSNSFARNLFIFPTFKGESYWHHLNSKSGKEIETLDSEKKTYRQMVYFMATIFVFVYLLTTIYLFWCCVICMCILKREVFKFTAWKNKKGACKNAVFKQVHIIISFLPFFIIPEFLQSLQILIKSCCTLLDK